MLTPSSRLRPNEAEVAAKVMDGEAIIINLSNGVYYSMDEVGGFIWERIAEGRSLGEIVETIGSSYQVQAEQVRRDVERLAAELLEEDLVIVVEGQAPVDALRPNVPPMESQYVTPQLHAYRDMADLLALDPPMPGVMDFPWKEPSKEASA